MTRTTPTAISTSMGSVSNRHPMIYCKYGLAAMVVMCIGIALALYGVYVQTRSSSNPTYKATIALASKWVHSNIGKLARYQAVIRHAYMTTTTIIVSSGAFLALTLSAPGLSLRWKIAVITYFCHSMLLAGMLLLNGNCQCDCPNKRCK